MRLYPGSIGGKLHSDLSGSFQEQDYQLHACSTHSGKNYRNKRSKGHA